MLRKVANYRFDPGGTNGEGAFLGSLVAAGVPVPEASYIVRRVVRSARVGAKSAHSFFDSPAGVVGCSLSMSALCMDPGCRFLRFYGAIDGDAALHLLRYCLQAAGEDRLKEIYVEIEEDDEVMPRLLGNNHFSPVLTEQVIRMPLANLANLGDPPKDLMPIQLQECLRRAAYLDETVRLVREGYRAVPTCFPVGNIPEEFIRGELRDESVLRRGSFVGLIAGRISALVLCVDRGPVGGRTATVELTTVAESERGKGLGIALRTVALNATASLGYSHVETLSATTNRRIVSAYRASGGRFGAKITSYRRLCMPQALGSEGTGSQL